MLRDFRFGARMLRKQPGFTMLAVLTLALGIGATSAVFSLIEGVLLSPPPYREPNRLVLVDSTRTDHLDGRWGEAVAAKDQWRQLSVIA